MNQILQKFHQKIKSNKPKFKIENLEKKIKIDEKEKKLLKN